MLMTDTWKKKMVPPSTPFNMVKMPNSAGFCNHYLKYLETKIIQEAGTADQYHSLPQANKVFITISIIIIIITIVIIITTSIVITIIIPTCSKTATVPVTKLANTSGKIRSRVLWLI